MSKAIDLARAFLKGKALPFQEANELWRRLAKEDELSLARAVLSLCAGRESL
jgi:hypothetical protein